MAMLALMLGLSCHLEITTAVAALFLIGAAAACFSATQYALVHVISPPEVRGRATGVLSLFIGSSMLGHYLAGQLFGWLDSAQAIRVMAVTGLCIMLVLGSVLITARSSSSPSA